MLSVSVVVDGWTDNPRVSGWGRITGESPDTVVAAPDPSIFQAPRDGQDRQVVDFGLGDPEPQKVRLLTEAGIGVVSWGPSDLPRLRAWRNAGIGAEGLASALFAHSPVLFTPAMLELKRCIVEGRYGALKSLVIHIPAETDTKVIIAWLDAALWLTGGSGWTGRRDLDSGFVLDAESMEVRFERPKKTRGASAGLPSGLCVFTEGVVSFDGKGFLGPGELTVNSEVLPFVKLALPEGDGLHYAARDCRDCLVAGRKSRIIPFEVHLRIREETIEALGDTREGSANEEQTVLLRALRSSRGARRGQMS